MKKSINKLNLNKMTISNLNSIEMGQLEGGVIVKPKPKTVFGGDCGTFKTFDCSALCTIKL